MYIFAHNYMFEMSMLVNYCHVLYFGYKQNSDIRPAMCGPVQCTYIGVPPD